MPNIHPFVVHFPIALLTVAFLCDIAAMLTKNSTLERVGWWNQCVGGVSLLLAIVTGLLAKENVVMIQPVESVIESHEQLAFLAAILCIATLFWRASKRSRIPERNRGLFLLVYGVGVGLLWAAGLVGGELVFVHGVGVTP